MPAFLSNLAKDFRGIYKTALEMKDEAVHAITSHADTHKQIEVMSVAQNAMCVVAIYK